MDKTSKLIEEKIKELTPQTLNLILTDQDNPLIKKSLYTWLEETFEAIRKSALEEGKAMGREEALTIISKIPKMEMTFGDIKKALLTP